VELSTHCIVVVTSHGTNYQKVSIVSYQARVTILTYSATGSASSISEWSGHRRLTKSMEAHDGRRRFEHNRDGH
jgi:hypothetical protein